MAEAAETEEKKLAPTSTSEDVGPCKIKLRIEVSADKVKEIIETKYKEINDSVALPGFRPGHAPRSLLQRKFGKAMLDDLKGELLTKSFDEIKEEKQLEPVGEPVVDVEKISVEEGKPFAYDITLEVRPKFELKEYAGVKVARVAVAVEDKDIEAVLRSFQEAKAELTPVEDGTARANDQIIADFTLSVEGKQIDASENNALFLDTEISFYGMALPEYHTSILDHKVGETVEFKVTLPADFPDKAYAGKEATIRTALKSVKRKKLPAIDADFVKAFDMDSVDELCEDVRKRILREKEAEARAEMSEKIVEHLLQTNDFPMPEGLVKAGAEESLARMHVDLAMRGVSEEKIHEALDKEKNASQEGMAKALKTHFILESIATKERIFVTEDQIDERVGRIAAQYGKWPHEMKAHLEKEGLMTQLRRGMREDLVREFLLTKAVVEEAKS